MSQKRCKHFLPSKQDFVEAVEQSVRRTFAKHKHYPTENDWEGIRAIVATIWQMAFGPIYRRDVFLSSLPTGTGKTTAICESVKEIVRLWRATGETRGVIILLNSFSQIKDPYTGKGLVTEMELRDDEFAVCVSKNNPENEYYNNLGVGYDNADKAPVVFTTQQYVEAQHEGLGLYFDMMFAFTFRGKPRAVRLWDEGIAPAQPHKRTVDQIDRLKAPLMARGEAKVRDKVEAFVKNLERAEDGSAVDVPDLGLAPGWFEPGVDRETAELLWRNRGHAVTVRHENWGGTVALFWTPKLPPDLGPCLVTDASGACRQTYTLWEQERGGLVRLPSSCKTFHGLEISLCRNGAGKDVYRDRRERWKLAWDTASRAVELADDVLILHRKDYGEAIKRDVREAVKRLDGDPEQVHFLQWGRHLATNEYRGIKHVILAGLLHYSRADLEAIARAAAGWAADEPLPDGCLAAMMRGEIKHHVYQAASRGHLRFSIGGNCPPGCTLSIIDGKVGPDLLRELLLGASVRRWEPDKPLTRAQRRTVRQLERAVAWYSDDLEVEIDGERGVILDLGRQLDWPPSGLVWVYDLYEPKLPGVSRATAFRALKDPRVHRELRRRGLRLDRSCSPSLIVWREQWPKVVGRERAPERYQPALPYAAGTVSP